MKSRRLSKGVVLLIAAIGSLTVAHARENLVNLLDWNIVTGPSGYETGFPFSPTVTSNGALFPAASTFEVNSVLTGILNTTPGVSYEITFNMQNLGYAVGSGSMSFGNFAMNCDLTAGEYLTDDYGWYCPVEHYDFIITAQSSTTTMSFGAFPDSGLSDEIALSDVMVTEVSLMPVPESSTVGLFGFGAGIFLIMQSCRCALPRKQPN